MSPLGLAAALLVAKIKFRHGAASAAFKNTTTRRARTCHCRRTRRSPVPSRLSDNAGRADFGRTAPPIYPIV